MLEGGRQFLKPQRAAAPRHSLVVQNPSDTTQRKHRTFSLFPPHLLTATSHRPYHVQAPGISPVTPNWRRSCAKTLADRHFLPRQDPLRVPVADRASGSQPGTKASPLATPSTTSRLTCHSPAPSSTFPSAGTRRRCSSHPTLRPPTTACRPLKCRPVPSSPTRATPAPAQHPPSVTKVSQDDTRAAGALMLP